MTHARSAVTGSDPVVVQFGTKVRIRACLEACRTSARHTPALAGATERAQRLKPVASYAVGGIAEAMP